MSTNETGRLTWNIYEDHSPVWNASSDTVYYSARSYPGFPSVHSLLLSIPRATGRARLMLESLQGAVQPVPALAAPALSPSKDRIAFVELTEVDDPPELCNAGIRCLIPALGGPDTSAANALLISGKLRVRPLNGSGSEASIPIAFAGNGGGASSVRVAYPFQRQYERDGAEVFRPSWSPDGTRLVFSDGLKLLVWTVGSPTAVAIPNTDDAVWPAWSPTGDIILFTKLFRTGSHSVACECNRIGRPLPVVTYTRVIHHDGNARVGTLMTIRPDGTDLRNLGLGESPAWSPNGQSIVFNRNDQLYRAAPDGSGATPIPNTQFGHEPAISPDGRWLTFSRDQNLEGAGVYPRPYDIWVVNF
ncbi:MAG TPA: hypothetical protein VFZ04_00590 [Longimicrobiales bacterium]